MATANAAEQASIPIPQPTPRFLTGNLADIDPTFPARSFWRLADIYGRILKLDLPGRTTVLVSDYDLINEVYDEERFEKLVAGNLKETRALLGDGLFTAYGHEPVCISSLTVIHLAQSNLELVEGASHTDARVWSFGYSKNVSADDGYCIPNDTAMGSTRTRE